MLPLTDSYDNYHVHPLHLLFFTIAAFLHVAFNRLLPRDLSGGSIFTSISPKVSYYNYHMDPFYLLFFTLHAILQDAASKVLPRESSAILQLHRFLLKFPTTAINTCILFTSYFSLAKLFESLLPKRKLLPSILQLYRFHRKFVSSHPLSPTRNTASTAARQAPLAPSPLGFLIYLLFFFARQLRRVLAVYVSLRPAVEVIDSFSGHNITFAAIKISLDARVDFGFHMFP